MHRALAIVLTRRIIDPRNGAWNNMNNEAKASIREGLWRSFGTEDDGYLLRKIAQAIAKGSEGWTELLPGLVGTLVCMYMYVHIG